MWYDWIVYPSLFIISMVVLAWFFEQIAKWMHEEKNMS